MSTECPPSSPVRFRLSSPMTNKPYGKSGKDGQLNSTIMNVKPIPTPDPSSSIGMGLSSPVKNRDIIPTSPANSRHSRVSSIDVDLERNSVTRLTIGRKKSVCDVVLPSRQNISRQHAFVTYLNKENKLKIKCNGTNGIVIFLSPNGIRCNLTYINKEEHIYKMSLDGPIENSQILTSFVLIKGETVVMPYLEGIKINFRQAEVALHMKENILESSEGSATESEDEMSILPVTTDSFHHPPDTPTKISVHRKQISLLADQDKALPHDNEYNLSRTSVVDDNTLFSNATGTPLLQLPAQEPTTPKKVIDPTYRLHNNYETPIQGPGQDIETENNSSANIRKEMFGDMEHVFNFSATPKQELSETPNKRQKLNGPNVQTSSPPSEVLTNTQEPSVKKSKGKSKKAKSSKENVASFTLTIEDLEKKGINCAEIQHILSNHLAFAAQQQTPLSQLQNTSHSISQLSTEEVRLLLETEKSIGCIKREGKDAAGKLLEEEFYYDIENDYDEDRRTLVTCLKGGRAGIRSSRKSHKQYFWKKPGKK
ncbi:similar to Saccharomyces cerevisiae YDR501W PLM2 Forkhead Associated domain containing protein and putative transcription factor found associated with chromatin [Maudiozyma barnettii]|uniref:Similar to Saccharomyces cerevisiae YDR501W PLM2 Forkhead Associated domain containing protein and putative transcription factor found associated with chromatin n=1 Tax=Maudiozyma barnettii TaxID=61262 RepID=A0A8H2VI40_9SACH|nr:Plm2p [Kazachstania barnettii]CAB4255882.1 similar to Saccharomyces cerevisiae YDR501W PLM2 Forkhead Associated domain containing protein and putative transcription factor found associated with chromatin [Kazachstania barnettii]CAD1784442.1 similar to Saccharomyces cerevisiae YDR501W PLM2 Forkhead Associated domain containing protein and putative transcription factor found associated with chromatin [Kazachstania barnettii]